MASKPPRRLIAGAGVDAIARAATAIGSCLHEPPQRAWRLALAARLESLRASRRANRVLLRLARGRPHGVVATPVERERLAALVEYARTEASPKLLYAMHAGTFILDLLKALDAAPSGMRIRVPIPGRSAQSLQSLCGYARASGKSLELLPIKSTAVRALLRPAAGDVGVLLIDLGTAYGRTVASEFFGAPAHFVVGPYALARALGASLVFMDSTRGALHCDGPFEIDRDGSEASAAALAQRFTQLMESAIAHAPTRWMRWHTLPELRRGAHETAPC
jgi:predicted LPLAT superfamily acyltransferase